MSLREPEFMKELHRIRAKLGRKWEKMSDKEWLSHLHKAGEEFKKSLHSKKFSLSHPK